MQTISQLILASSYRASPMQLHTIRWRGFIAAQRSSCQPYCRLCPQTAPSCFLDETIFRNEINFTNSLGSLQGQPFRPLNTPVHPPSPLFSSVRLTTTIFTLLNRDQAHQKVKRKLERFSSAWPLWNIHAGVQFLLFLSSFFKKESPSSLALSE